MTNLYEDYTYSGDINLEHGGMFFDLTEWEHGYVSVLEVIDLDSATGAPGAFLVEHKVVYINDSNKNKDALRCSGWDKIPGNTSEGRKIALAEAVCRYGYYDPDDSWDNYRTGATSVYVEHDDATNEDGILTEGCDYYGWSIDGIIPEDKTLLEFLLEEGHLYNF